MSKRPVKWSDARAAAAQLEDYAIRFRMQTRDANGEEQDSDLESACECARRAAWHLEQWRVRERGLA